MIRISLPHPFYCPQENLRGRKVGAPVRIAIYQTAIFDGTASPICPADGPCGCIVKTSVTLV